MSDIHRGRSHKEISLKTTSVLKAGISVLFTDPKTVLST